MSIFILSSVPKLHIHLGSEFICEYKAHLLLVVFHGSWID